MAKTTKRDLSNSLKTLLLKKPLNKVTVEDIASDCGVSRMTFYYYFADIYDLVEWTCQEEARKALAENRTYNTWQVGFLDKFYIYTHEDLSMALLPEQFKSLRNEQGLTDQAVFDFAFYAKKLADQGIDAEASRLQNMTENG